MWPRRVDKINERPGEEDREEIMHIGSPGAKFHTGILANIFDAVRIILQLCVCKAGA